MQIYRLSSEEIKGLELVLGLHTINPMDTNAVRRKLRRIIRHKGYHAANFVSRQNCLK